MLERHGHRRADDPRGVAGRRAARDPALAAAGAITVKLAHIHPEDLLEIDKGGLRMYGRVVGIRGGVCSSSPRCRGISYRHASARILRLR
jgi:hypothetical protein